MDTNCNRSHNFSSNEIFCDWSWDTLSCWPPTRAGSVAEIPCPVMKGSDPSKMVTKYCEQNGEWERHNNSQHGTNYSVCWTSEILILIEQLQAISNEDFWMKMNIAKMTRILEIIGLTASLIALSLSFTIYYVFRTLRNERTRIHINLFAAVFGTVLTKLVICIDQIIVGYDIIVPNEFGLDNNPFFCEITYVVLEYLKSSTYTWMFIEALHLHNAVAVTAIKMSFKKYYLFFGWGSSALSVIVWVSMMISEPRSHCWWGYNYNPLYWILEGPRITILVINTFYLINIIKVVFVKLRRNTSNEIEKIRKATKATLALLPLLGITNYLSYVEPKLTCTVWYFAFYTFVSYFLNSFQGMFIGLLYCLFNQEVKETILNKINSNNFISWSNSQQPQKIKKKECLEMISVESAAIP